LQIVQLILIVIIFQLTVSCNGITPENDTAPPDGCMHRERLCKKTVKHVN